MKRIISKVPGITDITVVRELGQPSLIVTPDREKIARYGLNVDDVNTMVETAMGGKAASQVIQGERQFDLLVRMQEPYRKDADAIKNLLIATPNGQHLPLSQFADIRVNNGASFIYRESNSRFIGVQFSVRNRDLAGAVEEARREVDRQMKLPARVYVRLGRRIQGLSGRARSDESDCSADDSADPSDPVRAVWESEIPADHSVQCAGDGTGGRAAGAVDHGDEFQRLLGRWDLWR